jgi:hypothetical protein
MAERKTKTGAKKATKKSDTKALNWRSKHHRGHFARPQPRDAARVGFGDRDFVKPIVGVANGHST